MLPSAVIVNGDETESRIALVHFGFFYSLPLGRQEEDGEIFGRGYHFGEESLNPPSGAVVCWLPNLLWQSRSSDLVISEVSSTLNDSAVL